MKLNKKEIVYLAEAFSTENPLSLFSNMKSQLDGTEAATLEEKGVIRGGKLTEEWEAAFEVIRNPERCARLILKDNSLLVEKYAYKTGDKIVLAENEQGEMLVSVPENFNQVIMALSEFTGMSNIASSDMGVFLPIDEALVLLSMMDLCRKNELLSFLDEKSDGKYSLSDVSNQLGNPAKNSLTKMLKSNYNLDSPKQETELILGKLIEKGIVGFNGGYSLLAEYEAAARSFLIPETLVMLEAFQINSEGRVITAGALCVTAGVKTIISFVFAGDEIEISSITGSYLLKIIENFLNCPVLE